MWQVVEEKRDLNQLAYADGAIRPHWAFTKPDDETTRDACRNLRSKACKQLFKIESKEVQTEGEFETLVST